MKTVDDTLSTILTRQEAEKIIEDIKFGTFESPQSWFNEFRVKLSKREFVGLTLAFDPERRFLKLVKDWFEKNLGKAIFIDLKIDPNISGGAVIVCNNHYMDLSLAAKIKELVSSKSS